MNTHLVDLSGKTIVITGASSGIGASTSELAARLGARVLMVARNREKMEDVAERIPSGACKLYDFDLQEIDRIPALVGQMREENGPLWGLVHSAGNFAITPLRSFDQNDFDRLMKLHLVSFLALARETTLKKNADPTGGSIVAISSAAAFSGAKGLVEYSSVKGALVSAVRSLALEFAPRRIRFNCVCPGWVKTPMLESIRSQVPAEDSYVDSLAARHPLGLGKPCQIAGAILFLLSDASSWITGAALPVDGGYSVA